MRRLAATMCAAILLTAPPSASARFWDVGDDHPYGEAIDFLMEAGVVRGYPEDRSYRPEFPISRVEFVHIVVRSVFSESVIDECLDALLASDIILEMIYFPDVDFSSWYGASLCIAVLSEIVQGRDDGTFHPDDPVNFAEASKILVSAFGLADPARHHPSAHRLPWYRPYIEDLADHRAIPSSITSPAHLVTRGEMAEMLYRLLKEQEIPYGFSLTYDDVAQTVKRLPYVDRDLGFAFTYPSTWPEPDLQKRGVALDGSPRDRSTWRLYIGHRDEGCPGHGSCAERPLYLDHYFLRDLDATLAEMQENEDVTILSDTVNENAWIILYTDRSEECESKRALIITETLVLRLSARCGAGDEVLERQFDGMLKTLSFIERQ